MTAAKQYGVGLPEKVVPTLAQAIKPIDKTRNTVATAAGVSHDTIAAGAVHDGRLPLFVGDFVGILWAK